MQPNNNPIKSRAKRIQHPEKYWLGSMIVLFIVLFVCLIVDVRNDTGKQVFLEEGIDGQLSNTSFVHQLLPAQPPRKNITFIMGEDKGKSNFYYTEAENYYRMNDDAVGNGELVTHCRSLEEVKDYLATHVHARPWGRINMVLHSNEWSGLGVALYPDGPRATTTSIIEALEEGVTSPLSRNVVDHQTELILYGCGLGRNEAALKAIAFTFGEQGHQPVVRSTRYFVYYESQRYNGRPVSSTQYLADYWYAFYKTGYRPGDIKLSRQLNKRYPGEDLDWRAALTRTQPRWLGDTYHHTFKVPVVWWVTYPEEADRPDLSTKEAQEQWLSEQEELQEVMADYNIPTEYFNWTFRKTTYTYEDGTAEPAIKAIGFSTILCVLQALTIPVEGDNGAMALQPALTDTLYYAVVH